jgi:hypothetical protein
MTPGSERDVFVYLYVESPSGPFDSYGAQLALLISGPASPLPKITTIDFSGAGYVYEGFLQGDFVSIDPSAGFRYCILGTPKPVDTNRRVLAKVHVTTTADVPLGDYGLDASHDFGPPGYYITDIDQPLPGYPVSFSSGTIRVVPEPMTWVQLLGLGAIGLPIAFWCRRRGHRALR